MDTFKNVKSNVLLGYGLFYVSFSVQENQQQRVRRYIKCTQTGSNMQTSFWQKHFRAQCFFIHYLRNSVEIVGVDLLVLGVAWVV